MPFLSLPSTAALRRVCYGRARVPAGGDLPRHRHLEAHAILVVSGVLEQISYAGRIVARAGDLLVQPTLDTHSSRVLSPGADIVRLPWPVEPGLGGVRALDDPEGVARLAKISPYLAASHAVTAVARDGVGCGRPPDWPDALADLLARDAVASVAVWASTQGLARETVSRSFARAFGISPATYRAELRARSAWLRIMLSADPLAEIAVETGFADQAHMTRAVRALSGSPPSVWRAERRGVGSAFVAWGYGSLTCSSSVTWTGSAGTTSHLCRRAP